MTEKLRRGRGPKGPEVVTKIQIQIQIRILIS